MTAILDIQKLRLIAVSPETIPDRTLECDLLIAGGGMGGCAAALTALRAGKSVVLTEETDWLGGQMTSQGVSALDENPFIETFSGTRSYSELRALIREFYCRHTSVLAPVAPNFNPGNGWVSALCFEPKAGIWALEQLLKAAKAEQRLVILLRHKAVSAEVVDDTVRSVRFRHLDSEQSVEIRARFLLDATELGDLLPLTGTEYVVGAEAATDTKEPHGRSEANPDCVQSYTYPFAVEYRPGELHRIGLPPRYAENREHQPYTLRHRYYDERGWLTYRMFEPGEGDVPPFWTYRRIVDASQFDDPNHAHDVAMINWPGNDFRHGSILDVPPAIALERLQRAKELSLGFCYWLQTECPRDEGGFGYPEFLLRPDVMGTADGLSKFPYIRESRRIRALVTVTETDISAGCQATSRARHYEDSVGIGLYPLDIHPAEGEEKIPPAPARPFQIPLSAMVPIRMRNLLPACKNLGVTHIANGAYRLHPVEWAIGEAAAHVAVFCLDRNLSPQTLVTDTARRTRLQRRLARAGVPLHWYPDLPTHHPLFETAQVLAAWGLWTGDPNTLEFLPEQCIGSRELAALTAYRGPNAERLHRFVEAWLPRWSTLTREEMIIATYAALRV